MRGGGGAGGAGYKGREISYHVGTYQNLSKTVGIPSRNLNRIT